MKSLSHIDYNDYILDLEGDTIMINSPVVTRELVEHIFDYYFPDRVCFDPITVKKFDEAAFACTNLGVVDLDTAKSLEEIGDMCFAGAYNVFCEGAFEKVKKVGKNSFRKSRILGGLALENVKEIPQGALQECYAESVTLSRGCKINSDVYDGLEIKYFDENISDNEAI